MMKIIKRTIDIVNFEVFNSLMYRILINLFLFLTLIYISSGDLEEKLISHVIILMWISINTYLTFTVFKKRNCEFLLQTSYLDDKKKISMLCATVFLENLPWIIFLLIHSVFFIKLNLIFAISITILYTVFAIVFAMFCSRMSKNNIGMMVILIFYFYNMFFRSVTETNVESHLISLFEQLMIRNTYNAVNLYSLIILIMFFAIGSYILMMANKKYLYVKMIMLTIVVSSLYSAVLYYDLNQYNTIKTQEFINIKVNGKDVEYRGISKEKAVKISKILTDIEKRINSMGPDITYEKYVIDSELLTNVLWRYKGGKIDTFESEGRILRFNYTSDNLLNDDIEKNISNLLNGSYHFMLENVKLYGTINEYGYKNIRGTFNVYVYQLFEGYKNLVIKDVAEKNNFESIQKEFSEKTHLLLNKKSLDLYNYIKVMGAIIYENFPDKMPDLYNVILKEEPQKHNELLEVLKTNFPEINNHKDVDRVIRSLKNNKK